MDDRFKFRIKFEIDNKPEIFDAININYETDNIEFKRDDGVIYNIGVVTPDVKLLQCTGYKDKNGKLIYDRDIIKVDPMLYPIPKEFYSKNAIINYVTIQARWMFAYRSHDNSGDNNIFNLINDAYYFMNWKPVGIIPQNTLTYIEVIGNTYENPELMEVENE